MRFPMLSRASLANPKAASAAASSAPKERASASSPSQISMPSSKSCSASSAPVASAPSRRELLSSIAALSVITAPSLTASNWLLRSRPALAAPSSSSSTPSSSSSLRPLSPAAASAVSAAFAREGGKAKAPVVLRLAFHDAAAFDTGKRDGGANGSIRFELDRPESFGLKRGWRVVEAVAERLRKDGNVVSEAASLSFADLIALDGAWAVEETGGPKLLSLVPVGRLDAEGADPPNRLPSEDADAARLVASFAAKGLSPLDLVSLSGAHTLGSKGFGDPLTFDNTYYKTLLEAPWAKPGADEMASHIGLPSDHALPLDPALREIISRFSGDQRAFFEAFVASYVKMVGLGV